MTGTAVVFSSWDWAIVALYFIANTAICIWCALQKEKDTKAAQQNKMKTCSADFKKTGKAGPERQAYMKDCLSK